MAYSVFCGKCGAPAAEDGDAFCRQCGAQLSIVAERGDELGVLPPRGFVYSRWFTLFVPVFAFVVIGGALSLAFGPATRNLVAQALATATPTETPTPAPTETPTATPTPLPTATPVPTPTPGVYASGPIGPVRIGAGEGYTVQLGYLQRGTRLRATVSVSFNSRLSYLTGQPDINVYVIDEAGAVADWKGASDGFPISWEAPRDGPYGLMLSNHHSAVSAKWVTLRFE